MSNEGDVVGYSRRDGVYAHLIANGPCDASSVEVSVGIYSASACGLYGFARVSLRGAGVLDRPSLPTPAAGAVLSLSDAEARALQHQPELIAQQLRQQAAGRVEAQARSNYFPQMYGNLTGVEANEDSAVAAGAVTTSSVSNYAAQYLFDSGIRLRSGRQHTNARDGRDSENR